MIQNADFTGSAMNFDEAVKKANDKYNGFLRDNQITPEQIHHQEVRWQRHTHDEGPGIGKCYQYKVVRSLLYRVREE